MSLPAISAQFQFHCQKFYDHFLADGDGSACGANFGFSILIPQQDMQFSVMILNFTAEKAAELAAVIFALRRKSL